MTEIEKKIVEYYKQNAIMCAYLKHANFFMDVEITFNGKTEYFSKESLMNLTKGIEYNWDEHTNLWSEETQFKNWVPSNSYVQCFLEGYFKRLEQNNE